MNVVKMILGKILHVVAKVIYVIMEKLIQLLVTIVLFIKSISKGLITLLSMGGCLLFMIFMTWGFRLLMNPVGLSIVLFFIIFPIVASSLVPYLKYLKYIWTEYLNNLANYLIDNEKYQFKPFSKFKSDYRRAEEERIRREQSRRYEQQREWQEWFNQQWNQQGSQSGQGSYGSFGNQGGFGLNRNVEFKKKYERSCDVLGVPYDVNRNQIKVAYRKMAKKYHPDLNKGIDATKIFQEITDAYEFLDENNISIYSKM